MADSDDRATGDVALGILKRWYQVPLLAGVIVFMFWTRFQNYDTFTRNGEGFWLQAIDSWYHWRATSWMAENVPWTLEFEAWTGFPEGIAPGQFGTLFDQVVVALSLVIGLGNPGQSDVLLAALIAVPMLAALVALPVYYLGKHLGTRIGGLVGAGLLALFAGEFFRRSTAGQFQHHAAEVLFMTIAVFAFAVALTIAERERPVWELVSARDWAALRRPTLYSAFAGVALMLYIWVWPPGIVLVGILGLFFLFQLSLDHVQGRSPDHIAFVGVVSMLVVAAGTAARINQPGFSATGLDFFQPTFALLVAGGCVFMAGLSRLWDSESSVSRRSYPAAIAASAVGGFVLLAVLLPGVFDTLLNNLTGRIVPFGRSDSALTVAEVDAPEDFFGAHVSSEFGWWAFYTGVAALPVLLVQSVLNPEERAKYLLVFVWAVVLISMAMTQARFNYYLAAGVAVLNAHLVGFVTNGLSLPESVAEFDGQLSGTAALQVAVVLLLVLVVFVPLLPFVASTTPIEAGDRTLPSGDAVKWEDSNEWLANNTPAVGNYAGAGNADDIGYDDRYGYPDDGSFDYPEGAYGVLSWWDYGHLITVQGERIPHANPFQQNARSASAVLTAQNESQAELYLDAIAAGVDVTHESNESELRETVEASDDPPGIQYVMIDDLSAAQKFPAITQWTGPDYLDGYLAEEQRTFVRNDNRNSREVLVGDDYYDTMLARLYLEDADGLEHYRLVHESSQYSVVGFFGNRQASTAIGTFEDVTESPGQNRSSATEIIQSFEQARAGEFGVPVGSQSVHDPYLTSSVKTFERVKGATLTGETDIEGTVEATVTMRTATNRTFTYSQRTDIENGAFELNVSYPTDETLGPADGYSNSSVRASGEYTLTAINESGDPIEEATNVTVPEADIQTGERLDIELNEIPDPPEANLSGLDIAGQGDSATVTVGSDEPVAVDVENVGEEAGSFDVSVSIGENASATVSTDELGAGENETVTFEGVTSDRDPGEYEVSLDTADDSLTGSLTVEPTATAAAAVTRYTPATARD
jgi:dolichyl-diphosphooligosaccharide--protein glycosyltransferase